MTRVPDVPPYFDYLLEGFRSGHAARNVHLGYWDDPPSLTTPCSQQEFETAQARLTDVMIELADLRDGYRVLDVGCGFGGTLEAAGKRPGMRLTGLNIDPRQLEICRSVLVRDNALWLVAADACALPFRPESFDRVFCVEAAFHFRKRESFLQQAAAVLPRGGRLVLSDILLRPPGPRAGMSQAGIENAIRREYGPWPQLWVSVDEITEAARRAGLEIERVVDASRQTLPTYRVTAPQHHDDLTGSPSAGSVLRWLHASGYLSYLCMSFVKT
jgi:cyclopropane fatty-acyl-phospholipid synthase-like methyltransferase